MSSPMTSLVTSPAEQARIFVAENDSCIRQLMQDLLEEEGYAVTSLRFATNAYDEINETLPDLVILDASLGPAGDGWLTLNKLRQNPETARVPVIICSADVHALRTRREELLALGCVTVEKPFDIDTLLTVVREGLVGKLQVRSHQEKQNSDVQVLSGVPAQALEIVRIERKQITHDAVSA